MRRMPIAFGWLTKRGDAATKRWLAPVLSDGAIRRDTVRVLREIGAGRDPGGRDVFAGIDPSRDVVPERAVLGHPRE